MNKNYSIAIAISVGLSLTSCKSFLDEVPESNRITTTFYQTRLDFYNALMGGYAGLKLPGVYASGSGALMVLEEIASDNTEFGATRQSSNNSFFEINDLFFTKSNTAIQDAWRDHYIAIGRLNPIIEKLPGATLTPSLTQAEKDRFDGEARFLRALYYFNLVRLYGEVQLITAPVNGIYATADVPRSPKEEVYKVIINDLTIAYNVLPATIPATEAGRASRWAARALLGKVYLQMKDYASALPVLQDVNVNSGRSLMASFPTVFAANTSYAANTEYIFAVQYKSGLLAQGASAVGSSGGVGVTQGSDIWSNWAPVGSGFMLGPNGGGGGGFNTPTADLASAFEPNDPRKNASLLESYPTSSTVMAPGRYAVKFRQQGALNADADVDFPILRFADVVLMYAEALNELGQTSAAVAQLNRIRTRVSLPAKPLSLNQADTKQAIEQERRVELAFENQRWPDLIRSGRYVDVMRAKGFTIQPFQNLYPVPQRETDLNAKLSQNPGY
ncbi:RagB/SusD family nutrient uptake outer membrane protein [Hymenobacter terrenus]|uniref:RagB/SusD family nutrient uptake outer membrane protein n=1 Tax=Hymenobacter terrenus TaxID=1629124 RepID=UPI000619E608|nr:RagB/SusD family nutrient uptake outer membrane protein [Hymenobacter terrenus]